MLRKMCATSQRVKRAKKEDNKLTYEVAPQREW